MRKHLFAKTAQDVRRAERGRAATDETQLHRDRRAVQALAGARGGRKARFPDGVPLMPHSVCYTVSHGRHTENPKTARAREADDFPDDRAVLRRKP